MKGQAGRPRRARSRSDRFAGCGRRARHASERRPRDAPAIPHADSPARTRREANRGLEQARRVARRRPDCRRRANVLIRRESAGLGNHRAPSPEPRLNGGAGARRDSVGRDPQRRDAPRVGGTGLRGYRLDGRLRFELLRGADTGYVQVAGRFAYVGSRNSTRFTIVDVRLGRVVGTARTAKPTVVLR